MAGAKPKSVTVDGQNVWESDSPYYVDSPDFVKLNGKWRMAPKKATSEGDTPLQKSSGLQGPIDDAFMSKFLFVRPTGKPLSKKPAIGSMRR